MLLSRTISTVLDHTRGSAPDGALTSCGKRCLRNARFFVLTPGNLTHHSDSLNLRYLLSQKDGLCQDMYFNTAERNKRCGVESAFQNGPIPLTYLCLATIKRQPLYKAEGRKAAPDIRPTPSLRSVYTLPRCSNFASVIAGISRIAPKMDAETCPSSRTSDTASDPREASLRPRANVAIFTPCLPSAEPTCPITPGSSRLRRYRIVPSSCASTGIPPICKTRGVPSCKTVPSTMNSVAPEAPFSGSDDTSSVFGKPCSRRRVSSTTVKPRAAATCGALTTLTFSSSTAFSSPASTALRSKFVPTSATSPAYRMRIRAGLDAAACATIDPSRSARATYGRPRRYWSGDSAGKFTALRITPSAR